MKMTNLDGENSSDVTNNDVKEKVEEETPIIEPIINLLQQLEDYSPTVSNHLVHYSRPSIKSYHLRITITDPRCCNEFISSTSRI